MSALPVLRYEWHNNSQKKDLVVLLHGWGFNRGVWASFIPFLQPYFAVLAVDLLGYGENAFEELSDNSFYESLATEVQTKGYQSVIWLGWSLGGCYALEMALRYPVISQAVCLIAATPCFLQKSDWSYAVADKDFSRFFQALNTDAMAALDHFMTLQCYGSKTRKKEHVLLKDFLKKYPLPSHKILQSGLEKLAQSDYREQIASLYPALWVILGENDVLVPAKVGHAIHALKPQAKIHIIPTAAHQPFLSHPEECAQLLLQLLSQSFLQSLSPVHVAPQSEPL